MARASGGLRAPLYGTSEQPVVGCVGRIKLIRKGQEFLLRAAAILKKRGVTAKHLIVGATFPGNEAHLDVLHAIARAAGLGDDVIFTGEIPDARPAYAAMNIFALPSAQPEPFGGVVMEAMGMGLPVVATKIGGSIEQVADGESGFRLRDYGPQTRFVRHLGDRVSEVEAARKSGARTIHPVKTGWQQPALLGAL